jgi:hypothetical protein
MRPKGILDLLSKDDVVGTAFKVDRLYEGWALANGEGEIVAYGPTYVSQGRGNVIIQEILRWGGFEFQAAACVAHGGRVGW